MFLLSKLKRAESVFPLRTWSSAPAGCFILVLQATPKARVSVCVCACMPVCPHTRSKFCFYPSNMLDKQNEYLGNNSFILFENFSLAIQSNHEVKTPTCSRLFIILSVKGSLCQAVRSSTNNNLLLCGLSWAQAFVILVCKKMSWTVDDLKRQNRNERKDTQFSRWSAVV